MLLVGQLTWGATAGRAQGAVQLAPDTVTASAAPVARTTHRGAERQLDVAPPRLDAEVVIDGRLDEPAWQRASLLTSFTQYNPVDGRPARDSSEVFVWYSPTAIHFGIRAYAAPGTVQATLADRDRIGNDDLFQILIDTFLDRRRAFVFAVNPFGIQTDGMRSEQGAQPGVSRAGLGAVDLTQDYIWQSKGRLTEFGYEVELRIPFKSIRYQVGSTQAWGIQVIRQTQKTGYQDTWAPTSRGNASFLVQAGRLTGLTGLQRGLVMDVTPVVTSFVNGAPAAAATDWQYQNRQQVGGDVRWGATSNFTLNGTVNPDFSQVEADVGQIPGDVRFALFFPELRPFFVEGSEQFDAPNRLVYTRQIVRPVGAVKLTGKIPRTDVGLLAAVDQAAPGVIDAPNPLFAIARLRRDLGANSTAGLLFTDREAGTSSNRVANADARMLFRKVYTLDLQAAGSQDIVDGATRSGSLLDVAHGRTGRSYGYRYSLQSISPDFVTRSGFVPRNDFVRGQIFNRGSFFGKRGARIEQYTLFFQSTALWTSGDFSDRAPPLETRIGISNSVTLKGGWQASMTPEWQTFAFDPRRYTNYAVVAGTVRPDTVAFVVNSRQSLLGAQLRVSTPQWRRFGGSVQLSVGQDPEFFETATVDRIDLDAGFDWRPTPQVRVNGLLRRQQFDRVRDGTRFSTRTIPRLRLEYQATRRLFFRFVGQYESSVRDALRDPRTDFPILLRSSTGVLSRATRASANGMRADWLLSYLPNPGTVFFAGYGASLRDDDPFAFRNVERTTDGFFVKFSYLYRVGQSTR
jgi:hypothetical protein